VWHRVGFDAWNIAKPAVFLIDRDGVIRYVFVADNQTEFPEIGTIISQLEMIGCQNSEDRSQETE
jgi:peroxiredoxin